ERLPRRNCAYCAPNGPSLLPLHPALSAHGWDIVTTPVQKGRGERDGERWVLFSFAGLSSSRGSPPLPVGVSEQTLIYCRRPLLNRMRTAQQIGATKPFKPSGNHSLTPREGRGEISPKGLSAP